MSRTSSRDDRERVIDRFTELCERDERIVAAFVGGSLASGRADRFSDLDLCIVSTDDAIGAVRTGRAAMIEELGTPLFLEDWGEDDPVQFAILADGTEIELHCIAEGRLTEAEVGSIRPLLDRRGILDDLELPARAPADDDLRSECRRILAWFWHDVAHTVGAIGRGQLWWALGQIEALRAYCVNVVRLEQRYLPEGESYWKIDEQIDVAPLAPLGATIVPPDRAALARAASELVAFFGAHGRRAAQTYDVAYPEELERLMLRALESLEG